MLKIDCTSSDRWKWRRWLAVACALTVATACQPARPTAAKPAEQPARSDVAPTVVAPSNSAPTENMPADRIPLNNLQEASASDQPDNSVANGTPPAAARFRKLPAEVTGVDFISRLEPDHPLNRLYHSGFTCGGIAIGDCTGDGLPDLFFAHGPGRNRLYRQTSDFHWEDITASAGVGGGDDDWGTGASFVDIDNDGDLDLYVCNYERPNSLYVNNGAGGFQEAAQRWALDIVDASLMANFADFDRDGHLDLYLLTNHCYRQGGRPNQPPWRTLPGGGVQILPEYDRYFALTRLQDDKFTIEEYGRPDYLFHNTGRGSFEDVTQTSGVQGNGFGLSATWWDYDHDGWPDIYVCNDFDDPDVLYHNQRDGTFRNTLADTVPHTPWFSMGSDFGDVNNDGLFDFVCVDMSARTHYKQKTTMGAMNVKKLQSVAGPPPQLMRNALYLNSGTNRFWEVAYQAGVADSDWSWAAKLADLDNDGWLDLYVSNGIVRSFNDSDVKFDQSMLVGHSYWDLYRHRPSRPEQNLAFRNTRELKFEDVSRDWGLDHTGISYAVGSADLDRDGDLDLIVVNLDEPVSIYRNESNHEHAGLTIELRGTQSNRYGIGATVSALVGSARQIRQLSGSTGFLSGNDPSVHFAFGADARPTRFSIEWPSGVRQEVDVPTEGTRLQVIESQQPAAPGAATQVADAQGKSAWFEPLELPDPLRHVERPYDDFRDQPLLPNQLSQNGPGLAVADVDRDGDEDLYLGGAAGSTGTLWLQSDAGQFAKTDQPAFEADAAAEDMGVLFVDSDQDDDLDLFVVSGGVEATDVTDLRDRLYLNDGNGRFSRADERVLPSDDQSGGMIAAADLNRDGQLDIFVGGRVIPGRYPEAPQNRLWIRQEGGYVDRIDELAPELQRTGLVTSAVWSDVNRDGWCDLLVAHEWGPVKFFRNDHGQLVDQTDQVGLARWTGWWNSISPVDIDGDLDMDYVVGNFGRNTKYHASQSAPAVLYYGDFDQSGTKRLVEAEYEGEHLVPIRGRSCSSSAMPFLRNKFKTYHDFALADLSTLYTEGSLQQAQRFEINTLDSGILVQQADGRFDFQPLPALAQAAPIFGSTVGDANGDGHWDVYVSQNFFEPQAETGRMDGGLSLLLTGTATGTLVAVSPARAGIVVTGDARGAAFVDWNRDHWPDLCVVQNNGPLVVLRNQGDAATLRPLEIELRGALGNRAGIGSRIAIRRQDGTVATTEVYAGQGYLTHCTSRITLGRNAANPIQAIEVTWPDGRVTWHEVAPTDERTVAERVD